MLSLLRRWLRATRTDQSQAKLDAARHVALQGVLGASDQTIFRPTRPMRRLGCVDVLRFEPDSTGVTYATTGLIGDPRQLANRWGHYELMIRTRQPNDWAPQLISQLAAYTYENTLEPGDTMDLSAARSSEAIQALLFCRPNPPADSFTVLGSPAGLLLVVAITPDEFVACKTFGSGVVLRKLRDAGVYPHSDLARESVMG